MTTSTRTADDRPIIVRDRRRKGFFTIDNELLDRFGAQLKAHGLAVYMALARFANQDGACWPSLSTIAKLTGMSRRQVIRELAELQALSLIAVTPQIDGNTAEHKANLYTLLDVSGSDYESPGSDCESLGGGDRQSSGSDSLTPKQHLKNKTQHRNNTQRTTPARDDYNNNSGGSAALSDVVVVALSPSSSREENVEEEPNSNPQNAEQIQPSSSVQEPPIPLDPPSPATPNQAAEQALLAFGIGKTVAQRLATRYRSERILEKIEFLAFLQAERPDTIENPRGWLRRAIEEDYGAPDGYRSAAERAQQAAEEAAQAERAAQAAQQQQDFAARLAAQEAVFRQQLTEQYGTTEADERLWQEVLLDFKGGQPDLHNLFSSAQILSVDDERVQLGFTHEMAMRRLQHRGTRTALKRALKAIAKRPLEVETVLLSQAAAGYTGEDGASLAQSDLSVSGGGDDCARTTVRRSA